MLSCSQILRFAVPKRPKASLISGMVDHAEYLIGVFDNQKKLRSGTAQTVNYALHQGK